VSSLEVGADAPRWRARWTVAALGVGAFVLLVGLEVATEDEAVKPLDLLGDAVQIAVLDLTAMATGWLAARVRSHGTENRALLRDIELARAEGEAWRRQAHSYLAGLGTAIDEPDVVENKFYAAGIGNVLTVELDTGERSELVHIIVE